MAEVIWNDYARWSLDNHIGYAYVHFGKATALRWRERIKAIEERLRQQPLSYPPEELLLERVLQYRRCHIMKHRFKLIYYYDETDDAVYVIDIWDTRMSSGNLQRRIR